MTTRKKQLIAEPEEVMEIPPQTIDFKTWAQSIFRLFDDQEILKAAQVVKPKIDGFGPRSLSKVPVGILRKKTLDKLSTLTDPEAFVKTFYKSYIGKYKNYENHDDLIWNLCLEENQISRGAQIMILAEVKPDFFLQVEGKIKQNITEHKYPMDDLVDNPSFSKEIEMLLENQFQNILNDQIKNLLIDKYEDDGLYVALESGEQELLDHIQKPDLENLGHYILLAIIARNQWTKWEEADQYALLRLVQYDASKLLLLKAAEIEHLQETLKEEKEISDKYKKDIAEYLNKYNSVLVEWHQVEEEYGLLKKLLADLEQKNNNSKVIDTLEPLITDPNVLFITFQEQLDLDLYLSKEQCIYICNNEQLEAIILENKDKHYLWFLDTEGCSTKMTFSLEQTFRKYHAPFRLISGDKHTLVRKIIFHLEGEFSYEAH